MPVDKLPAGFAVKVYITLLHVFASLQEADKCLDFVIEVYNVVGLVNFFHGSEVAWLCDKNNSSKFCFSGVPNELFHYICFEGDRKFSITSPANADQPSVLPGFFIACFI